MSVDFVVGGETRLKVLLRAIWALSGGCLVSAYMLATLILVALDHRDELSLLDVLFLRACISCFLSCLNELTIESVNEALNLRVVVDLLLHDITMS